jgi:hypothetical protein
VSPRRLIKRLVGDRPTEDPDGGPEPPTVLPAFEPPPATPPQPSGGVLRAAAEDLGLATGFLLLLALAAAAALAPPTPQGSAAGWGARFAGAGAAVVRAGRLAWGAEPFQYQRGAGHPDYVAPAAEYDYIVVGGGLAGCVSRESAGERARVVMPGGVRPV